MRRLALLLIASFPLLTQAGSIADVEIYDHTAGTTLPIHEHRGRLYVAGEPQHRYEVRIRNQSPRRVLAVTSVDGVNVISGETAAKNQRGYVIDAYDSVDIDGWRKNMDEVATFYFTGLADSYAARTGRPDDVGVIGVALFREQQPRCCEYLHEPRAQADAVPPPEAQASGSTAEAARQSADSKLGTGHGHREASPAQYVDFRRASKRPDETLVIYYDSRRNLVAQGVMPPRPHYAGRRPDPFPQGFVPDP